MQSITEPDKTGFLLISYSGAILISRLKIMTRTKNTAYAIFIYIKYLIHDNQNISSCAT